MQTDAKRSVLSDEISRRAVLKGALGTLLLGAGCRPTTPRDTRWDQPNIVVIILDALRASSLPMYGCPRDTAPFLADLSTRSSLFSRCYSSATWTIPSVASILSALPPRQHRVTSARIALPADMPTLPKALKNLGYRTGSFTAQAIIGKGYGMERHFDHHSFAAAKKRDGHHLIDECERWLRKQRRDPVFVYAHFFQPHGPYDPPASFIEELRAQTTAHPPCPDHLPPHHRNLDVSTSNYHLLGRIPFYIANVDANESFSNDPLFYLMLYEANIRFADSLVEKFLSRWEHLRGGERTLFVITADHGESFGRRGLFCAHGFALNDAVLHVPLLVFDTAYPDGREIAQPVSHLDLANSILETVGSEERLGSLGEPVLFEQALEDRPRPLVTQEAPPRQESGCAITVGSWRLLYNEFPQFGNGNLLAVRCGRETDARAWPVPLPVPATALKRPRELAPGVIIENLGIHTPYVSAQRPYALSGALTLPPQRTGSLSLRVRIPGREPAWLEHFECTGARVDISGELPPLDPSGEMPPGTSATCEARWDDHDGDSDRPHSQRSSPPWQRLFTFPVFHPRSVSEDLALIGAVLEPPVACPGAAISATYIWRCLQRPKRKAVVYVHFLNDEGEIAFQNDHLFFRSLSDQHGEPMLTTHVHTGFRFDESFWIDIPKDLPPGDYRVRVGLYDQVRAEQSGWKTFRKMGEPVHAANLTVVEDPREALRVSLDREPPISFTRAVNSSLLREDRRDTPTVSMLERLADRLPDQGHAKFLLALHGDDQEWRRRLLLECLEATPFHLGALRATASESWGKRFADALQQLTPGQECDFVFQDLIRLYGFDLQRAPGTEPALYLSLYWEALAPVSKPYAAELQIPGANADKPPKELFWFLGGGRHPTHHWAIGEAVVDTVYLPLRGRLRTVAPSLRLYPHWDAAYAAMRSKFYLSIADGKGHALSSAALGSFDRKDLPVSEADLLQQKRLDDAHYGLYDLSTDPLERDNLVTERPDVVESLRPQLLAHLTAPAVEWKGDPTREIPEELKRQMRAIGYTGE